MMKNTLFLLFAIAMPALSQELPPDPESLTPEKVESIPAPAPSLGVRLDCTHDANATTQSCLTISGLRLGIAHYVSPRLSARLILDAFGTPLSSLRDTPNMDPLIRPALRDTRFALVESYAVDWRFRPYLKLSVQSFSGTTQLPSVSRLALADRFQDAGWDQTALTATYLVPALDGIQALFAMGNGEGENGLNHDPQQYAGLAITAGVRRGLKMKVGASFDGNSAGSDAYTWQYGPSLAGAGFAQPSEGFSADRKAAAIWLDGNLPAARGLMASIGWQQTVLKDLDRAESSVPAGFFSDAGRAFDLNQILIEDAANLEANIVKRSILSVDASYLILAEYFVGMGYTVRTIHSDIAGFETPDGTLHKEIVQNAMTFGVGSRLDDGLTLTAEYQKTAYDRIYRYFHERDRNGAPAREGDLFNLRLAYQWD